ncbi:MAG: RHS repeat-associated core domain-containing protein [Thermoanaerobaculia bacterium]
MPQLVENNGSGFRVSQTYQLTGDVISPQPVEVSTSASFTLYGRPLITSDTDKASCGIFINANAPLTNLEAVSLGLVCGHASGCTNVQLSNNGVGWSGPFAYSTSRPWTLVSNDGTRSVFARYQNGLGNWSGVCFDSIVLDKTAPSVSISPTGGTYMSPQQVAVTASELSTIRFTTDGSDPKTSPTAADYAGPVNFSSSGTLRAYAVDRVGFESPVVSETYEICGGSNLGISGTVVDATRNNAPMPLVVITLDSAQTANTDLAGHYSFSGLPRGWYTIESVTAPVAGYVTYQDELKLCEASVAHDIVLTRQATIYGLDTNSGYSSEGVNTSTGNFARKVMDIALPGRGPSFVFERTYNSQDASNGVLGHGWTWGFNIRLAEWPDGEMVLRWGDGKTEVWNPDGSGGWTPMYGVFSTLFENPGGTFTLKAKDLIEYRFDASNRLEAIVDEYGNTISFNYSGANLATVADTAGRVITFSHDASGRITNLLDPIGRSVSFVYDVDGDLVTAINMDGTVSAYTYDSAHRMLTITDSKGNVAITNVYDTLRSAVISQRDAFGHETRYLYDVPNKITTIIDAEGNVYRHHFDDYLRLIQEDDPRGYSSYRVYGARGSLESVTDKNGNVTTYEYDASGNVLTKTEPLDRVTTATYDAQNNPLTKTDARGHSQLFEYDPVNGNLLAAHACGDAPLAICASDPSVAVTTYGYNPLTGQMTSVTEATGTALERTTTYQYDVFGNNVAVIDALGRVSTYQYDAIGRKVSESHPLGRATAYEYDEMDRLIAVIDALGGVANFMYDDNGNKTDHWDANGQHTGFAYDAKNRLVTKTDALGQVEQYGYDGVDRRVDVFNARGATASVVYDGSGNVAQELDPLGNTVRYEYDGNGNRTAATNARGHRKELVYDELNLLVAVTDPLGNTETFDYDLEGNQTHATNALGKTTISTFDAFSRLETVTDPEGNSLSKGYDLLGQLVSYTDARGHATSYEHDRLGRLIGVLDAESGTVGAAYDELGNRTSIADPRGKITSYFYDVLNRLVSTTDPLGNQVRREYDPVGNLETLINADGTTTFQYDALYRVTEVTQPDLSTITYAYDEAGNRLSVSDTAGVTSFAYDMGDRVTSVNDPFGNTVGYTYDPDGNRSSIQYPGYKSVYYLFDELNRVVQVQDWGGVTTTYDYDEAGRLKTQTMGNGVVVSYGYDEAGRLTSKEDRTAAGQLIASFSYTLDPNGNRTGLDLAQPLMPQVDPIDQAMSHNDGNQVVSNNAWAYVYDAKGNRVSKSNGDSTTTYTYDFNNRLSSVNDGATLWEYRYTSNGHRIASNENGVETRWLLDLNGEMENELAELNATNAIEDYFVYGDGLLYTVDSSTGERLYYHYDPIGSTVALSDSSGEISGGIAYLPYGEVATTAAHGTRFGFVGKYGVTTESNGLLFMRARYYDPIARCFVSPDPIDQAFLKSPSLNTYGYASGDPVSLVDPRGLMSEEERNRLSNIDNWDPADEASATFDKDFLKEQWIAIKEFFQSIFSSDGSNRAGGATSTGQARGIKTATVDTNVYGGPGRLDPDVVPVVATPYDPGQLNPGVLPVGTRSYDPGKIRLNEDGTKTYPSAEYISYRRRLRWMNGDAEALARWEARQAQPPRRTRTLKVAEYAKPRFEEQYRYILADDFLDKQTRTFVELQVQSVISALSTKRYKYRDGDDEGKERARAQREADVSGAIGALYAQLTSALSKHQVIIRDLASLPVGTAGGVARTGVYAGGN